MIGPDYIYPLAEGILTKHSNQEVRRVNEVFIVTRYEDSKIVIEGLWPLNYLRDDAPLFENIYIALKIAPQNDGQKQPFPPIMTQQEDTTLVYRWNERLRYYRKGRWENYLRNIVEQINKEVIEQHELNARPVDDSILFPDLADK